MKQYIVVEINDRNHHLCIKQAGSDDKYTSVMNGRNRFQVHKFCEMLNDKKENQK